MSAVRRAWYAVLVFMARGILRVLTATCRFVEVRGAGHLDALREDGQAAVIVYWHQMQVFCAWYLMECARRGLRVSFLTSPSVSGEVPAAILRRAGAGVLRGSSKRSAGQALRDMHQVIVGERTSLVITPDGPTGPCHEFKTGTVMLARMTRAPIVMIAYASRPCIRWRSWDRFIVPLPFSKVAIVVGEPYVVPPGASTADLAEVRADLERRMAALVDEAAAALAR